MSDDFDVSKLREVESVALLRAQPGDVLVIECGQTLSYETAQRIEHAMIEKFPGHKVLVLADGLKLKVARGLLVKDLGDLVERIVTGDGQQLENLEIDEEEWRRLAKDGRLDLSLSVDDWLELVKIARETRG